ncbi:MAG: hypothetical protein K0S40_2434 [Actinomycetospora sp.]|nr:hypothetical protein [Actinomycetospora sp.]
MVVGGARSSRSRRCELLALRWSEPGPRRAPRPRRPPRRPAPRPAARRREPSRSRSTRTPTSTRCVARSTPSTGRTTCEPRWCSSWCSSGLRARLRRRAGPVRAGHARSGWRDSNPRPLAPKASALPSCATPRGGESRGGGCGPRRRRCLPVRRARSQSRPRTMWSSSRASISSTAFCALNIPDSFRVDGLGPTHRDDEGTPTGTYRLGVTPARSLVDRSRRPRAVDGPPGG